MTTSLFDLYKVGVGPSSSHTMGPMRAAVSFTVLLAQQGLLDKTQRVTAELYGSLALTGIGHATDRAVLLGLSGEDPATIDTSTVEDKIQAICNENNLQLGGRHTISFVYERDLIFHRDVMNPPGAVTVHPNGLRFYALDADGKTLLEQTYFSIGGGFIVLDGVDANSASAVPTEPAPYDFKSAAELLAIGQKTGLTIWQMVLANECALMGGADAEAKVRQGILRIWNVMLECMERGATTEGILPGGLKVRRRAARLAGRLQERGSMDPLAPLDWVNVFAMAVNEENAAGGRVVTAPTNGAAGVVPAVGRYYQRFIQGADDDGIIRYFLTSAAIGALYKENASISGAEVGCQGEVGVACSMAAGGLVAAMGGTNDEVEHAAEVGMEHNLGMTCDPIAGLVQIPCIERNAMGAVKAVHACRIAMNEGGPHKVSLDQVIRTMYLTGLDMQSRYKETSLAGLALNIIEC